MHHVYIVKQNEYSHLNATDVEFISLRGLDCLLEKHRSLKGEMRKRSFYVKEIIHIKRLIERSFMGELS